MDTERTLPQQETMTRRVAAELVEVVPRLMRLIAAEAQASGISGSLTITQLRALGLLERGPRLPSEMARELRITPATTSEVVDLLVRRGLVERGGDPEDRRLTVLRITRVGSVQRENALVRAREGLARLVARLASADVAALERALEPLGELAREGGPSAGRGEHGR